MNSIVRPEFLEQLAELILIDCKLPAEVFRNRHSWRGARARQIFTLVLVDFGVQPAVISEFMGMDPSYVSQVKKRNWKVKQTPEFARASRFLQQKVEIFNAKIG